MMTIALFTSWAPLWLAILLALFGRQREAWLLLALFLGWATIKGAITPQALSFAFSGLVLAWRLPTLSPRWRMGGHLLLLLWMVALLHHKVPGFHNPLVLERVLAGGQSVPFNLYFNYDKPLIFFALLLAWPDLRGSGGPINRRALLLLPLPMLGLLLLAWQLGALRPEVGLPDWWLLFAINNLLLTCVVEEALFRGYLQQGLVRRFSLPIGLPLAALLFGADHLAGGPLMMIFAALAGLCYGLAFHWSQRLWVAVLFHFALNITHLALFTYPLARH
ncbi:CPBP family intramembrane glutamic endopeptidase [Aeromonas schubertii]